jgi:hypothetical protein
MAALARGFAAFERAGTTRGAIIAEPMPIAKPVTIFPFNQATNHLL